MKLTIATTSGEPIYEQIKRQIRSAVLCGELRDGEALPSLRKLAGELKISVLTVTRAYTELADEGIVQNRQGKGTFVTRQGNKATRRQLQERIKELLTQASALAKAGDIELLDLLGMLETSYNSPHSAATAAKDSKLPGGQRRASR